MRIAVIGGGLFGCTAAIHAAREGNDVHLFEPMNGLMLAASGCSYYRLHRGYHYPRSPETGREGRQAERSFRDEYGQAVTCGGKQIYVIPNSDQSHVTADEFAKFVDDEGLPFQEIEDILEPWLYAGRAFSVAEPRINLPALTAMVRRNVDEAGVFVRTNSCIPLGVRDQFDQIIVAAYAGSNNALMAMGCQPQEYKFQVVEKPVVLLPAEFRDTSVVVMDGPFGCVDPYDDSPLHVLGHVVHTVHAVNVGIAPIVPAPIEAMLHRGVIRNPETTRFPAVVNDLGRYISGIDQAIHVGSVFVLRAVLAGEEATDRRPTLVERVDDQVVRIFSGKLGTAVVAARAALSAVSGQKSKAA
jgi:hypothetical protein